MPAIFLPGRNRKAESPKSIYQLARAEDIDWVGVSWSGQHVLIGAMEGTGRLSGLTMADLPLKRFSKLDANTAHSDVGVDAEGKDVIVMQNARTDYIDLIPIDWKTTPTTEGAAPYEGTGHRKLVRLFYSSDSPRGLNSGIHISCNAAGYCVISAFTGPKVREQNWLDRSIILVKLDATAERSPKGVYLAKVHGTRGEYWEETQATITSDGSRVVWAENWNENVGRERPFVVQLDLPRGWREMVR